MSHDDNQAEHELAVAIAERERQASALVQANSDLGWRLGTADDRQALMDAIEDNARRIDALNAEIGDLRAGRSMNFPGTAQITAISQAVGRLEGAIRASAAAGQVIAASAAVFEAWFA